MRHVGQVVFEDQRLVIRPRIGAVAAAQDGDLPVPGAETAGDVFDTGRLAGAADGQVANTDHGHGGALGAFPAAVEQAVAQGGGPAIGHAGEPQSAALERRPQAAPLARQQRSQLIAQGWSFLHRRRGTVL